MRQMRHSRSHETIGAARRAILDWTAAQVTVAAFVSCMSMVSVNAQDLSADVQDFPDATLTEPQWRKRVDEARRQSEMFVANARSRTSNPPAEDQTKLADERALNDDSLQRGDIVSTSKGFFVYLGRGNNERTSENFSPAPQSVLSAGPPPQINR